MLSLSPHQRYFVYNSHADMRKSFDGLCGLVRNNLQKDPSSGDVFVFFNRTRTHVKILSWEQDGYALYYKRLERGTYELPDNNGSEHLSSEIISLVLQGIVLSSVKRKKRYRKAA
jgi:transposase